LGGADSCCFERVYDVLDDIWIRELRNIPAEDEDFFGSAAVVMWLFLL